MQVHEFVCFGEQPGEGNPALVVVGGNGNPGWRRALARERNLTCVFLDPGDGLAGDGLNTAAVLDFVYPHMRSPLCLHATLAAAQLLFERHGGHQPLKVKTAMHGQSLLLMPDGENVFVQLARQEAPRVETLLDIDALLPERLLAAPDLALASAPRVASVGSPKLLLEVADVDTLYGLAPDLALIHVWGKEVGVNGCYVWCRTEKNSGDGEVEGRNFNHLEPGLEDSATGVAAGALTLALGQGLTLRQGRATGRNCVIRTALEGALEADTVLVGGLAQRVD
ncbi:PhzF family phenazine biosynthesis protein [Massilia sp.]|uniref:PhzF family phenazine biosynthesis protein n=1 Tax=Massilia sp. TaxID=1882437 RepID=UPI00289BF990|nr:PhzF family phenazine biosynthesis protein [Massilia sp.]